MEVGFIKAESCSLTAVDMDMDTDTDADTDTDTDTEMDMHTLKVTHTLNDTNLDNTVYNGRYTKN
jgi:hypothetical protein